MPESSRLRWLCRRGMKELDVLMRRYLDDYYEAASSVDQAHFRRLLALPDPDLYNLLLGRGQTSDAELDRFAIFLRRLSESH